MANKTIHPPSPSPPFKAEVFFANSGTSLHGGDGEGKGLFLVFFSLAKC